MRFGNKRPGSAISSAPIGDTGSHRFGRRAKGLNTPAEQACEGNPSFGSKNLDAVCNCRSPGAVGTRRHKPRFLKSRRQVQRKVMPSEPNGRQGNCHRFNALRQGCDGTDFRWNETGTLTILVRLSRRMMLPSCAKNIATHPQF